jgi:hypothetical protein
LPQQACCLSEKDSILNGNITEDITNKLFIKQPEQDSLTGMKH